MKRTYTILGILLTLLLFVFLGNLYFAKTTKADTFVIKDLEGNPRLVNVDGRFRKPHRPLVEGDAPYTPTKLEWLVLTLNSKYNKFHSNYAIYYEADDGGNKVLVYITYEDLPVEKLKELNKSVQINALALARRYGWQNWVEVDVFIIEKDVPECNEE